MKYFLNRTMHDTPNQRIFAGFESVNAIVMSNSVTNEHDQAIDANESFQDTSLTESLSTIERHNVGSRLVEVQIFCGHEEG